MKKVTGLCISLLFAVMLAACASTSEKLDPNMSAEDYFNRGNEYAKKKDNANALADFGRAIRLDPDNAPYYYRRADLRSHMGGSVQPVIDDFNQAIRLDPNNASYYFARGNYYDGLGASFTGNNKETVDRFRSDFYNRAGDDYIQAIKLDPDNVSYYKRLGNFHERTTSSYELAIVYYSLAIQLDPNNELLYSDRGGTYFKNRQYALAIADLSEAIKLDKRPTSGYYYNLRGQAYYNLRNYDSAIADYEEAVRLDPGYTNYQKNLEQARQARGR